MVDPTQAKLHEIVSAIRKMKKTYNKADAYRYIMKELNAIGDGTWTYPYIANLHRGAQLDTMSDKIVDAINKLHRQLTKKPKSKTIPSCQSIKVKCSPEYAKKIRDAFTTEERFEMFEELLEKK